MWNPIWGFDFKVTMGEHIVTIIPGGKTVVPVFFNLIRGKPQTLDLDVNTNWESMGLSAKIVFNFTAPMPQWKGNLFIESSKTTPPGSYLFTVRASAKGTFHTSEDAVTVIVEQKEKKKEKTDEDSEINSSENDLNKIFQSKSVSESKITEPSTSFSLDNLFKPKPAEKSVTKEVESVAEEVSSTEGGLSSGIIMTIIFGGVAIFFSILMMNGGGGGGGGGTIRNCVGSFSYECTDCSGSYEKTYHNSKYIGECRATSVRNGDICTLSCR